MQDFRLIFRRIIIFPIFSVILLIAAQAQANIFVIDSRAAFIAAFPSATVEGWDADPFTDGYAITNGSTVNGVTYQSTYGDALVTDKFAVSTTPNGLGQNIDGYFYPQDSITFSFTKPIRAFGIDINAISQQGGTFKATTSQGFVSSVFDPFPDKGTGQFVGFTSDVDIYWVTIGLTDPDSLNSYTLDTMRYIPLPGTLLLLGSGLAGLGLWRGRKRFMS
jgi:hypothetical protein